MVPEIGERDAAEETVSGVAGLYLRRLERCARLKASWQLYLKHNLQLAALLDHVARLSYRDCVRHGLKAKADAIARRIPAGAVLEPAPQIAKEN